MNQIYDETLALVEFDFEVENFELLSSEINYNKQIGNSNPKYFEELISIEKAKNKVISTITYQYNIFRAF